MNKLTTTLFGISFLMISASAFASHTVSGYYNSNGTYVQPHMSMDPYEAQSSGYSYHNNQIVPYGDY